MATPLISLGSVKEWLNTGPGPYPPNSDGLLARMIGSVSLFATSYLQRPIAPETFSEVYSGNGHNSLPLRKTPVILVRSVTVGTTVIAARTAIGQLGFVFDSSTVRLDGCGSFCRGIQNVAITYDAGYQQADTWTVPSGSPPVIDTTSLSRPWNIDRGVAYATGAAFTLVTTAPTLAGTYQLGADSLGNPTYVFAPADVGASVVITYGYTPEDIQQALIEILGERYRSRTRIGETSQNIKGMVVAFSQKDMSAAVRTMLQPYRSVTPVQ